MTSIEYVQSGMALDVSPLEEIDWNFEQRADGDDLESIHPYPAKFVPDIPGSLLDRLSIPQGSLILDPFVGSGTTLVEARRRGLEAIGIDLNPIATLISRVKTNPLPKNLTPLLELPSVLGSRAFLPQASSIDIPNIDHWFSQDVKQRLSYVKGLIDDLPTDSLDIARVALSSIIVRVSRQDSDTRYAAINNDVDANDVDTLFSRSLVRTIESLQNRTFPTGGCEVMTSDALEVDLTRFSGRIGAVITSPPYPNAYEYWLYHKYRMYWLGEDPIKVKQREIGARAHFFKKSGHTKDTFLSQMMQMFTKIVPNLHSRGWIATVVGRSLIHGEHIDNSEIMQRAAKSRGLTQVFRTERTIKRSRKSFNLSHARISTETIQIFVRS